MPTNELRMPDINQVMIAGRMTRDPELQSLPAGATLCKFGIAHNKRFKSAQGEDREETIFVDVTAWARQADWCATHLKRGYPVLVTGRLSLDTWDDNQTGAKRTKMYITAHSVQALTWDNAQGDNLAGGGRDDNEPLTKDDIPF